LLALHGSFLSQSNPSSKLPPHIPGTFCSCVERMQRHFICLLCMDHYCRNHILLLKLPPCIPGTFSSCVKRMLRHLLCLLCMDRYCGQSHSSSKAPTLHSRNFFFLCQMHAATSHPQQQQQQQEKGTRGLFGSYETWSPEMPLLSFLIVFRYWGSESSENRAIPADAHWFFFTLPTV
jgi:hypothetical protein